MKSDYYILLKTERKGKERNSKTIYQGDDIDELNDFVPRKFRTIFRDYKFDIINLLYSEEDITIRFEKDVRKQYRNNHIKPKHTTSFTVPKKDLEALINVFPDIKEAIKS